MAFDRQELESLIRNPAERLDVELKCWIDPSVPACKAKIAIGCIALRNYGGGCMVIGFNNDGTPDPNVPANVQEQFSQDTIQGIVSAYASHRFEVVVEFVPRDGVEYPIICVPGGVETPVAAKADLYDPPREKPLIRLDTVYVRTLHSNNIVSSAAARWQDYEQLTKTCFDNREADIGAFVRRHLAGLDLDKIGLALLKGFKPDPTPIEQAISFLDVGKTYFLAAAERRKLTIPEVGTREAAIVIAGKVPEMLPDENFLNRLQIAKPNHTGWTPWVDTQRASDATLRPYVLNGGYEAIILDMQDFGFGTMLDFWRMEPAGKFYHLRGLEDDMPRAVPAFPPGTLLDFLLQISRTAEVISIGLSFARSMGCDEKETALAFAFRWTGLKDRYLASWVEPSRSLRSAGKSEQDEMTTTVSLPLETPRGAIAPYVEKAVAPLFVLFDGKRFESSVIEGIVNQTVGRRF